MPRAGGEQQSSPVKSPPTLILQSRTYQMRGCLRYLAHVFVCLHHLLDACCQMTLAFVLGHVGKEYWH